MKFKNFVMVFVFLSFAAVIKVQAQFAIYGTINGRVVTANGSGIRRAGVSVINLTTLETETRQTNDFGYFRFNNLPILNLYLVTVNSKRYSFPFSNQLVEFTALEHNMTFVSDY
jgi:Carboxypeptidase regulatory-like domain